MGTQALQDSNFRQKILELFCRHKVRPNLLHCHVCIPPPCAVYISIYNESVSPKYDTECSVAYLGHVSQLVVIEY